MNILIASIHLPLKDPILIFLTVLLIVLVTPLIFRRLGIPEVIGLILAGVAVGPHGLNLLSTDLGLSLFATIGLLYLMFLAGLEIDIKEFKANKKQSISLGLLTFLIPLVGGFFTMLLIFNLSPTASLLVGSMLATHTLVAYPIVSSLGISRQRIVGIIISATIIADTLALLILALISETNQAGVTWTFALRFIGFFSGFLFIVLYLFPRLSSWFFKNYDGDSGAEFIFVLTIVLTSSAIAELAHIEPIVGAFFAGIALNRHIPHTSPLMNRLTFSGHNLFIPFFLISVGMLVDLSILIEDPRIIYLILVLLGVAIASKWLPAFIFQRAFRAPSTHRKLIFGLSDSRAASAIAIILVGYNLQLVDETILNATVIIVLITSLISSLVTQRTSKKIALELEQEPLTEETEERILIPISNPKTIEKLINFAVMIKDSRSISPIYPITVVPDDVKAEQNVIRFKKQLDTAKFHASATDHLAEVHSRVDTNVADGLARAVKEMAITKIILGWHGRSNTIEFFFGSLLDNLVQKTAKAVYVLKLVGPLRLINNIHVYLPELVEREIGFPEGLHTLDNLAAQTNSSITFWGYNGTEHILEKMKLLSNGSKKGKYHFRRAPSPSMLERVAHKLATKDLLVIFTARKNTISYNKMSAHIPRQLDRYFQQHNVLIMYPEQEVVTTDLMEYQL
ncbi:MAG: cation:proton antiporter [Bacteroidota bacterium]